MVAGRRGSDDNVHIIPALPEASESLHFFADGAI